MGDGDKKDEGKDSSHEDGGQRQAVLATLQVPSLQMFLAFLPQESKATCFHTRQQFFAEKTHEADGF